MPVAPGTLGYDLSTGTPGPALLHPLAPALAKVQLDATVTSYLDDLETLLILDEPCLGLGDMNRIGAILVHGY